MEGYFAFEEVSNRTSGGGKISFFSQGDDFSLLGGCKDGAKIRVIPGAWRNMGLATCTDIRMHEIT